MPQEQTEALNQSEVAEETSPVSENTIPETSESTSEVVKTETEGQEESQSVPKGRFDEVNRRAKLADLYEEILMEHSDLLVRGPNGRLKLDLTKIKQKEEPTHEDLADDEKAVFGELHQNLYPILEKKLGYFGNSLKNEIIASLREEAKRNVDYQGQSNFWYERAIEDFGEDVKNPKSPLRQRAMKILKEEFAQTDEEGNTFISPQAQYDAFARALTRLQKEAKKQVTNPAIKQQGKFVSTGGKGGGSQKLTNEEFAKLSHEEQLTVMKKEHEEKLRSLGLER